MTSQPPTTTTATTAVTTCGQCGVEERKLLHNVRLRGNFRRLCTTCVLRLHSQCFCPSCLGVFDRTPPDDAVVCYKCYSSSHPTCISLSVQSTGSITSARGPTPCASCLNPSLLVLNLNRGQNDNKDGGGGRCIDKEAARLLLCAGKIAANSMSKAEVAAGMEADRRAKEAAFTKKRAREALDHVVKLMAIEKKKNSKKLIVASSGFSTKVYNNNVAVVKDKKVVESSVVLEALNAVELKENGSGNGSVAMDVDGVNGKDSGLGLGSGSVVDAVVMENGGVKSDELVKVVEAGKVCDGEGPGVVENGVVKPKA
ncbi:hypothetical protein Tco_0863256 [Tanacetum coccineum]